MNFSLIDFAASSGETILEVAQDYDAVEFINRGIAYAIILAGFLSVAFVFFGGISFILSGGDEAKIKQAVSTIRYAILGLIITLLSVVIVGIVGRALGVDVIQYINLQEIINLVQGITGGSDSPSGNSLD